MRTNRTGRLGRDRLLVTLGALGLLLAPRPALAEPPGATGELRRIEATTDEVLDVAFMPDGRRLLLATGMIGGAGTDHSVHLWDDEAGREVRRFAGHEKSVHCLAVAPDGKLVASGSLDETVRLWDPETGAEVEKRHVHRAVVLDVAFAPDGRRALTGSWDYLPMDYWDVPGRKRLLDFGVGTAPVNGVAFTPDGRHALTAHGDKLIRLWDLETGKEVRRLAGHEQSVDGLALAPDGRRALSGGQDGTVRLWDVETGREIRKFAGPEQAVRCVALAPDGRRALAGGDDGVVRLWDVETGAALAQFEGHAGIVRAVAFSPDGRRALSGGSDRTARVWDLGLAPADGRRTLAVLDFADLGPAVELAVLRKALAEMLIGDLTRERELRVVERGRVEHVLDEARLGKGGLVDAATARVAGRELAADLLLTGSLAGSPEKLTIKAALTRPGAEKPMGEWTVEGPSRTLFDLERDLAGKIRATLGLGEGRPAPTVAVLGFKDLSPVPRLKEMEGGFSEILQAELAGLEGVRLVERAKLDALLREQKLALSGLVAADSAAKVGRLLGAERMIFGSFIELGANLRIEARLVDVETAAILDAETAEGPAEAFAGLVESLARKLARDLTARPPVVAAGRRARAASPTRKLEAARHFAAGKELLRQGRNPDAAAAFGRVLLLEPDNLDAHYWRVDAWYGAQDYAKAVEAAELGLGRTFTPDQFWARDAFRSWLSFSYIYTHQPEKRLELLRQIAAEGPKSPEASRARVEMVGELIRLGKRREGIALLKTLIAGAKEGVDRAKYDACLREGFAELRRSNFRSPDAKEEAALAAEILELMLRAAEDHRDPEWDAWGTRFVDAIGMSYHFSGATREILPPETRVADLRRVDKVFRDRPRVRWDAQLALATDLEALGKWKESREAYLYVAGHLGDVPREQVPCLGDMGHFYRQHWLDRVIRARVKAAMMLGDPLADRAGAAAELRSILRDYGVAHQQGAILGRLLHQQGQPIEIPGKAALIVGGGGDGWQSWSRVLGPLGYAVHPYDLDKLTGANLAPYSLVVLARQGGLAFEPAEILAFRSYVATGGSLLVVASPGWTPAQPGVLNPLLAFFGVHARREALETRIWANLSDDHPLVKGLERKGQMLKCAIPLDAPEGTMAVRWYEKKVMVALPYREGRVVVSSFGQWFLPDISDLGEWWTRAPGRHTQELIDQAPLEGPQSIELPLLKNAVAWLAEPLAGRPEGRRLPADFLAAHRAALEVLYRLRPRNDLAPALDTLVAGAGGRREEALWVAGESGRSLQWFDNGPGEMMYAWKIEEGPPRLDPRPFQELAKAYPRSELAPFARWEAAETDRLNRVFDVFRENGGWADVPIDAAAVVPAFEGVDAPKGSYAWAWAQLRLAMLHTQAGHPDKALEPARAVADSMDPGPEKVLALFLAAGAAEHLGRSEQAARYLQAVKDAPEIAFPNDREDSAWAPATLGNGQRKLRFSTRPSRSLADAREKALKRGVP